MSRYTLEFKQQALQRYKQLQSRQRTAGGPHISRTLLRVRIAAYDRGGLAELEHPQVKTISKRKNPFIADKPDAEKTPAELLEEARYLRAEPACLQKLAELEKRKPTSKKPKPSKN